MRRTRKGGIYESYFLDPEKKIKMILLDNRWDLDELDKFDFVYLAKISLIMKRKP